MINIMIEILQNLTNLQIFILINNLLLCGVAFTSIVKSIRMKYKRRYWVSSLYYLIILVLNSIFVLNIPY